MNNKPTVKYLECYKHELKQAKNGDVGIDIRASEDVTLYPLETKIIPTNLCIELPRGYEAQVRPRSGLSSKGLLVHLGTVDNGYRGQIGINTTYLAPPHGYDIRIKKGERIAQLVIKKYEEVEFEIVKELSETDRGSNGFGHTGVE